MVGPTPLGLTYAADLRLLAKSECEFRRRERILSGQRGLSSVAMVGLAPLGLTYA